MYEGLYGRDLSPVGNPTLEPNITSIGKPVAKLWPFLYIQDRRYFWGPTHCWTPAGQILRIRTPDPCNSCGVDAYVDDGTGETFQRRQMGLRTK